MCIYPFSLGAGKSTLNVLGVGSGTGEECGDGARGDLWGAEGDTGKLGNETLMTAFTTEAQKGRRKSKRSAPSLPSLPISLLKHCCSDLSEKCVILASFLPLGDSHLTYLPQSKDSSFWLVQEHLQTLLGRIRDIGEVLSTQNPALDYPP